MGKFVPCSGLFKPGMNAIMGPTGGGKTSLLDVLAGRKHPAGLMGTVLVDGATQPANFKCVSGYVIQVSLSFTDICYRFFDWSNDRDLLGDYLQDDIVMGMLTVRENIAFSAALRLSPVVNADKRSQKVEEVIEELGLEKCANSKVG